MRKTILCALAVLCAVLIVFAFSCSSPQAKSASYGDDRALIEDLQARYMFALDFKDVERYVMTFTEDGVLDIGDGEMRGRAAIRKILDRMPETQAPAGAKEASKLRPATGRHNISNIVVKIDGDKATGRAYWFHYGNDNPQRTPGLDSYGHYEDEMVKVDGVWLFSKRKIYNEQVEKWAAKPGNPSW